MTSIKIVLINSFALTFESTVSDYHRAPHFLRKNAPYCNRAFGISQSSLCRTDSHARTQRAEDANFLVFIGLVRTWGGDFTHRFVTLAESLYIILSLKTNDNHWSTLPLLLLPRTSGCQVCGSVIVTIFGNFYDFEHIEFLENILNFGSQHFEKYTWAVVFCPRFGHFSAARPMPTRTDVAKHNMGCSDCSSWGFCYTRRTALDLKHFDFRLFS